MRPRKLGVGLERREKSVSWHEVDGVEAEELGMHDERCQEDS